jgi:hypothetical protein
MSTPEIIAQKIHLIRGAKVMLDSDLAELYGVETRVINQAVARNEDRFPEDFMFTISGDEYKNLKSQIVISSWGGRRRSHPRVFTEHGILMLSSVLQSKRAIAVNINIMRAFVRLREMIATHKDLARKIEDIERKLARHEDTFAVVFRAFDEIKKMLEPEAQPKRRIGFK